MLRSVTVLSLAFVGCVSSHHQDNVTCGSTTCDVPANRCLDMSTLRSYTTSCIDNACSYASTDVACGSAGCCDDHCCTVEPSNADVFGQLEPTGLTVAPPQGTFDTDTDCSAAAALGSCAVATRTALGEACVCRMDTLMIDTLRVTGSRALVILAYDSVDITTLLDVSGAPGSDGPGASRRYATARSGASGGVGASYQTAGGGSSGTVAAATYGESTLVPLIGGMRGQASNGVGGGGGGAVQITANVRISVPGVIDAGGGGGGPGTASEGTSGAGGGGSGGAILLEAPSITMTGALVANGGGGGGGGGNAGSGGTGSNGDLARAFGGFGRDGDGCPLYGYVQGGAGGAGAVDGVAASDGEFSDYDSRCLGSPSFVGAGGGGGGVGRIRVSSTTGCQCQGTVSPRASFGILTAH